ncbi:MAG: SNF2 helicase associated domain-containing protein [Anaerolineales bacterium]|nr:SNF2 helicase associated domain-containing protein [Anaerolineales bacterium]
MHSLTPQLLKNYPFSRYADPKSIQRGQEYFKDGRVWEIILTKNNSKAVCEVGGDSGEYTVEIEIAQKSGQLSFDCTCPYAVSHFCKHMVASALAVIAHLQGEDEEFEYEEDLLPIQDSQAAQNWQNKLNETLALVPRRAPVGNFQQYAALVMLTRSPISNYAYGNAPRSSYTYTIEPFIVKANDLNSIKGQVLNTPQEVNDFLFVNQKWAKAGEKMQQQMNPEGCINLSPDAISFLNILQSVGRLYGIVSSSMSMYLSMLAKLEIPVFLGSFYPNKIDMRLHLLHDPVDINIDLQSDKSKLTLQAGFEKDDKFKAINKKIEVISSGPTWVLMDDHIAPLRNTQALSILSSFPIVIPLKQEDVFRERYFAQIAQLFPIKSDIVHWHDVYTEPVPRLYLHDDNTSTLSIDLRFGYGDHELPATKSEEDHIVKTIPGTWDLVRVYRRLEREQYYYQLLIDPTYHLKRAGELGVFELRARTHPFDFLLHSVPQLTQAGFEIYGEDTLKIGKINRNTATLRVSITSGIDWFDLKTVVEYGDQKISLHDLRKSLKRGDHYIKLADGSVGQIPKEWLEKYKHLWNLAEETGEGFRVSDLHLPLLDQLLEEDATLQAPPDLIQRRERLSAFEKIKPQRLPKGFTGELRPYQKHGFDWLHFLKEYKFGGILADDMGLGKTVQVLAYLQSQQEQAKVKNVTLLVVPKSLIANWQRESEKFTPSLRFLEYIGNLRSKDVSIFSDYDVVLTTYGTMLRDIEILREHKFHHVILDESQAIKNPLAKSAKAARLLKADHRIVMTGTPVENNTFELWSQFSFLNPGLLGSMEYFKHEFANPIESGAGEAATAMLRKLVYPFILRRTKEQVAPELPPRTERIVYTDMDTAQKKLYTQTREKYRAELLGLIESEGMNDARFKILEGLLRLRQIAIHPVLVDKTYKGEAPKFEILLETLETLQAENHKALIFSQFVETLKLVKQELDKRKIKYIYLDGKTQNRQAKVDEFQNNDDIKFFLISLKAGGVGLNLTAAEYVIHLDPWWNPAVEMQASDRAHRIGQKKPVFVYKIIARDTVEEKILQLQEKKRALVKSIISSEASFFKSLTKDDINALFS